MGKNRFKSSKPIRKNEKRRRRRELTIIAFIAILVALLTLLEFRLFNFGSEFPVSNTLLMFSLMNINLLLLLLLIFLVFRNLVKLLYDRKRKILGSKLRTRLVAAFITLTLLPTSVLFFFSLWFITTSIAFWFNAPVEQALENSLKVGQQLYQNIENHHRFFLERIAYQLKSKKLLAADQRKNLDRYVEVVRRSLNFNGVEIYTRKAKLISVSTSLEIDPNELSPIPVNRLLQKADDTQVYSISENGKYGEVYRSIGTVPFSETGDRIEAFVVISQLIPPELSTNMASISKGFDEYQQMKLLKNPVRSTYYITLSIVALLVVFCAVWFGFYLARSISIPIQNLAEGTRRVAEGDLGFSIANIGDDEIGSLVDSFNRMTGDLRINRQQLEHSAQKLREQNYEIEQRRRYMEIVLRNISAGVISLDANGYIKTMNKAAERLLDLEASVIINKPYQELINGQHLNLTEEVIEDLNHTTTDSVDRPLRLSINHQPRSFILHINALKAESGEPMGMVVVFDDLTDLEKAERMAAWREVARRIAHEVKNPLTPIALSAERLKRRYAARIDESIFEECTQMIIDHVALIRTLVNEFSAFAKFPTANPKPYHLPDIIEETVALYKEGHPEINFMVSIAEKMPRIHIDRQQIKQALINLVDNAVAALRNKGSIVISLTQDPILKMIRLEVADNGPGISDEDKTRLFEPNFSTKSAGMGLGLTIVNSIIMDHKGMVRVVDNQPKGAKFVIELPM
jgi:two-component system nitrogen regulation sensor histidine kinase NtrY